MREEYVENAGGIGRADVWICPMLLCTIIAARTLRHNRHTDISNVLLCNLHQLRVHQRPPSFP